jgi:hypothetical protein
MSLLKLAANLLFGAMSSSDAPAEPPQRTVAPPSDISELFDILAQRQLETEKRLEGAGAMLNALRERQIIAARIQRRWNYGLAAGLVLIAALAIVSLWRH